MENKQTAVDWLTYKIEEQRENGNVDLRTTLFYCEQAKAMEKEQIEDAYCNGFFDAWDNPTYKEVQRPESAEQYYNETYGGNKW